MKITKVRGREILDSRGFPTVECILELENGRTVCASVPAGASVGVYEAVELRDGNAQWFLGKGVSQAINNLETKIGPILVGKEPDIVTMDRMMLEFDGTENKANVGANAILAASIAVLRAQAQVANVEVYGLLAQLFNVDAPAMPRCMFNIINGGMHADSGLVFQEFMITSRKQQAIKDQLHMAVTIYQTLKKLLHEQGLATSVGDEGGFAPHFELGHETRERVALDFLVQAIEQAGYSTNDVGICLDVAASAFYDADNKVYVVGDQFMNSWQLVELYTELCNDYPIISIEDGISEDDWDGWELLTKTLGQKIQLVGDDLFVTNVARIKEGVDRKIANAVLIKPNQIGTVSQTVQALQLCKQAGYKTVVSHRSGETNDTFIADLVVGTGAGQFKAGAPVRGERVAKYNRLLKIEEAL